MPSTTAELKKKKKEAGATSECPGGSPRPSPPLKRNVPVCMFCKESFKVLVQCSNESETSMREQA